MKFHNAILSFATATTLTSSNGGGVDAKIWTLRGLGGRQAANNNNNNNPVVVSGHSSESVLAVVENTDEEELPTPSANLRELLFVERKLAKNKDKNTGGDGEKGGNGGGAPPKEEEPAAPASSGGGGGEEGEEATNNKGGGNGGGGEKKKGKMDELIGAAVYTDAPDDVKAKAGCDEPAEEEGDGATVDNGSRFRRFLKNNGQNNVKKKGNSKASREDVKAGKCDHSTNTEPADEQEIIDSGLVVPVEASGHNECDPEAVETCEAEGVGEDPTLLGNSTLVEEEEEEVVVEEAIAVEEADVESNVDTPPFEAGGVEGEEVELNEEEATSRRRRLTVTRRTLVNSPHCHVTLWNLIVRVLLDCLP